MKRRAGWPWLLVLLAALAGGAAWLWHAASPESPLAVGQASRQALRDPALIARGRYLAGVGDCAGCHTAPGGAAFAGGRMLPTPFGNIPAPNLTPDPATGLGRWGFGDFWQAVHAGRGRHGELLYPAFPYTSYTRLTRDDALAIFAYLQSLPAVHRSPLPAALRFPYSLRASLTLWRALYFHPGVYRPDPRQTAQWNRGAYLVQGPGHCNECHAARNALGATAAGAVLSGGEIPAQDWYAPDLSTGRHGGLAGWSAQDIVDLLASGQSSHGTAFGPMAEVVAGSTQHMSEADLKAVASYLQSLPPRPAPTGAAAAPDAAAVGQGEDIYRRRCASCHGGDGRGVAGVYPPLSGNASVTEPTGINAIRVVLLGGFAPLTRANPRPYSMPPFAQQLSDSEVAAVVSYLRQAWGNQAGAVTAKQVARYRHTPVD